MQWDEFVNSMVTRFILDPHTSSLDLLPNHTGNRYKNFKWDDKDYKGGPLGPNEGLATDMVTDLNKIRPERRVNQGSSAILTKRQFNAVVHSFIVSQLETIPNFPAGSGYTQSKGHQLNKDALSSFLIMRSVALKDQVPLVVGAGKHSAYRSPGVAAKKAKASGNSYAVANFSAHSFGLAIDLNMSYKIGKDSEHFKESTTNPMQNVVDMRTSPVHKWMFLRGQQYGWYPYQHEPWHWEYNPPGFREVFLSKFFMYLTFSKFIYR